MNEKLEPREQAHLLEIINSLYGSTGQFEPYKYAFNQRTLEVTEALLMDLRRCNHQMKILLMGIAGGASLATRGWLRGVLQKTAEELKEDRTLLNGAACRNTIRSKGTFLIIETTIP